MTAKIQELDEKRRDDILNSALKEFASQGYDKASTNIIAKEAKMSKSLMFHYVGSKKDLFLAVYDYFSDYIKQKYFDLMNYSERDIFKRLRQSYLLQIEMLKKYPFIFDFNKLSRPTKCNELNNDIEVRISEKGRNCYPALFDDIDTSKFRKGLDIEICKKFIFWANVGFTNQILEEMRDEERTLNLDYFIDEIDTYFNQLKKIFYES